MSLIAIGMKAGLAVWLHVSAVTLGGVSAVDLAHVTAEVISAVHDVEQGRAAGIVPALLRNAPEVLSTLTDVLGLVLPEIGIAVVPGVGIVVGAIGVIAVVLTFSHRMTPAEERLWMDRASQPSTF